MLCSWISSRLSVQGVPSASRRNRDEESVRSCIRNKCLLSEFRHSPVQLGYYKSMAYSLFIWVKYVSNTLAAKKERNYSGISQYHISARNSHKCIYRINPEEMVSFWMWFDAFLREQADIAYRFLQNDLHNLHELYNRTHASCVPTVHIRIRVKGNLSSFRLFPFPLACAFYSG